MAKHSKKKIDTHPLTKEEFSELTRASTDIFYFAQFAMVIHPVRGKIPFLLYPYQIQLLYQFIKHKFNVILKFRQAGVTELIALFCLWLAMYHDHKNVIIISIKDRVAKRVLRKIKFMYENLPSHLKTQVVNGRGNELGTSTELEFANGSIISSIPTTEDAGRSEAVSLLVIDEAAIVRWAESIWAGLWPTLSTGGRAIVNSTAYGVGNFFHKLYTNAVSGGNKFNPIRLHWQMHPERDQEWYEDQLSVLGPRRTAQEVDGDFLSSGNTVFNLADIRDVEDNIMELEVLETRENGLLKVFNKPQRGTVYYMGADIATGRANDYTTFSIMDRTGEEQVCYKGKIPIDRAEKIMMYWAKKFNRAIFAPESNDIGLGLAHNVQNHGYPNLYYSKSLLREKGKTKPKVQLIPGWYTTKKNRPLIIAGLEEDVRNESIIIKDKFFCDECPTFIYDSRNRPVAMNKDKNASDELFADEEVYSDDAIFGKAITNHIRKQRPNRSTLPT